VTQSSISVAVALNNLDIAVEQDLQSLVSPIQPSPIQTLHDPVLDAAGVSLQLKRDDLIHPCFGGNKWRKLQPHIEHMQTRDSTTLVTFGGAWSNHIHATAAAGEYFGFNTIGVIRGEPGPLKSSTLAFAERCGMKLHYVSRKEYRNSGSAAFINQLRAHFGNQHGKLYFVPEGGKTIDSARSCQAIIDEIQQPFDVICCSCGTGTTLAGIIAGLEGSDSHRHAQAIGFPALKIADRITSAPLIQDIESLLTALKSEPANTDTASSKSIQWRLETGYHFGGYAKTSDTLAAFIRQFRDQHAVPLDMVYTGKMLYGLYREIQHGTFPRGTRIIAVHSGGLQGNRGFML
jgi:1-aminocyclopropane-1-carboxylate deaminase